MTFRFPFDLSPLQTLAAGHHAKQTAPVVIRSIQVAGHITAQGLVVANFDDGRITVDAGGQMLTGWPINPIRPILQGNGKTARLPG